MAPLRALVAHHARKAGLDAERTADLVLSVNELAANSIQYAGGSGTLRIWHDGPTLICEVSDPGRIPDPLVGRRPPGMAPESSRGLWVINQLCDLVQVRSCDEGTVVRLHVVTDGRRRVP
jgi:anti-sigma regulatory factor (Ser/Thr protein kinase)